MRLYNFGSDGPADDYQGRYLAQWPGYSARPGQPAKWRNFKSPFDEYVALQILCSRCGTPVCLLGRSLLPGADPRAVLWATLHGAVASFRDGPAATETAPWEVREIIFIACGTKRDGVRCSGEVQRNLGLVAQALDELHKIGRPAVLEIRE